MASALSVCMGDAPLPLDEGELVPDWKPAPLVVVVDAEPVMVEECAERVAMLMVVLRCMAVPVPALREPALEWADMTGAAVVEEVPLLRRIVNREGIWQVGWDSRTPRRSRCARRRGLGSGRGRRS